MGKINPQLAGMFEEKSCCMFLYTSLCLTKELKGLVKLSVNLAASTYVTLKHINLTYL